MTPEVSIVVPSYNGGATVPGLVAGLERAIGDRWTWEVIIVNDVSPDGSWSSIRDLAEATPQVLAVDLMRNVGQGAATLCGLALARGDIVVTMDDDLQHPPDEVPRLVEALEQQPDLDGIIGRWDTDRGRVRGVGTAVYRWVARVGYGSPKGLEHTAFRALRRPLVDAMVAHTSARPIVSSLMVECSHRLANLEVRHDDRRFGESGYSTIKGLRIVWNELVQASLVPLHAVSILGFSAAAISLLVSLWVLVAWAFGGETPPGWASSLLATTFLSGTILVAIGLLGRYIEVVIAQLRRPPRWTLRDAAGVDEGRVARIEKRDAGGDL